MKRAYLPLFLIAAVNLQAWIPGNWVYQLWPYAYESGSDSWFWFYESGNQWVYTYPPSAADWERMEDSAMRNGWTWYAWPYAYSPGSDDWHYMLLSPSQWVADIDTAQWSLFGHPLPVDPLETETISGSTTQTGNLNNRGLAVYHPNGNRHLYSAGQSVYAFDPATGSTETVLTLPDGGRPTFLNMGREDNLYLIESRDGWLLHHNMADGSTQVMEETQFKFASCDLSALHLVSWRDAPYEAWRVRRLSLSTNRYGSSYINRIENLNVTRSRCYYTLEGGTTIELADAGLLMGRSNICHLDVQDIVAVREMVVDPLSPDNHRPLIGLILETAAQTSLYLLQVTDSLEGTLTRIATEGSGSPHSLAFDGTYFYFIKESAIHRVDKVTHQVEKVVDVSSEAVNLNVVNHWLYFGENGTNTLYRVHPVTRRITALP